MRQFLFGGLLAYAVVTMGAANAGDVLQYDFAAPYLQRTDKIFPGAGDTKDVNAATHVIDPWPPYVANRRIPANGERMVGGIERYRDTRKLPLAPLPLTPVEIGTSGFSGGGASPPAASSATGAR